ncbi:aspartyl-phosphate phosphatase Spo0E family protein [Paenibacillus dendritiformis]|uniref:aspartyl-phosphate phosphatase Spo0E family protein n=1 Tax=Paenibacillus dendritiformis TaxID=130049 RepID=UPI000A00D3CC|nr:aspartyl-phosphate phosphatase Spo0E family protein [Paenibacillus dendritiformis]CAH8768061.1 aspartyl-phosphate phosphatase Spo0E family protein [Paenibacillus dendritiformis]
MGRIIKKHCNKELSLAEKEFLTEKIEELRQRLVREAASMNSLDDEYIVRLSQELDTYILEHQKMTHANREINGKNRDVSK